MRIRGALKYFVHTNIPGMRGWFHYFEEKVYFSHQSLIFRLACEQGIYESENLSLLSCFVKPGSVYFDIGANIGLLSIPILKGDSETKVVSIEASPGTFQYLHRTQQESQYGDRWVVLDDAIGSVPGEMTFYKSKDSVGAYDGLKDTGRGDKKKPIPVKVRTLDEVWHSLNCPDVSVIKMDIEGGEYDAIVGGGECIASKRPVLHVEWNRINLRAYGRTPGILLDLASNLGYCIYDADSLNVVNDEVSLKLRMLRTESFLLIPENWQGDRII